jgi:pyruvate ferredoxin oxidoreductase beta subunit
MIAIAVAHGLPYVAQCTAGFLPDIEAKVKKALEIEGPAYIQIMTPCIPGWGLEPDKAMEIGRMGAKTGIYPLLEYINGELVSKMKVGDNPPKVEEYLKLQGRFAHLFKHKLGKKQIEYIQEQADKNIEKYGLKD